jgi:hypothetical protein
MFEKNGDLGFYGSALFSLPSDFVKMTAFDRSRTVRAD